MKRASSSRIARTFLWLNAPVANRDNDAQDTRGCDFGGRHAREAQVQAGSSAAMQLQDSDGRLSLSLREQTAHCL